MPPSSAWWLFQLRNTAWVLERLTSYIYPLGDGIQGVMSGLPRDHLASEWPGCGLKIPALEPDSQDSVLLLRREGTEKTVKSRA